MRTLILDEPFPGEPTPWVKRGIWPGQWVGHPEVRGDIPAVVAYRLNFNCDGGTKARVHVTADHRYKLYLDGEFIGRGSERGDRENWFYETYDLDLSAGDHVFVAQTWHAGFDGAAYAQVSVRHGFLLAGQGAMQDQLSTGIAKWECKKLGGYEFTPASYAWGVGSKIHIHGKDFNWDFEKGAGNDWQPAEPVGRAQSALLANESPPVWRLRPAVLPAMLEQEVFTGEARHVEQVERFDDPQRRIERANHIPGETVAWNRLLLGEAPLSIPPWTRRRVIVDLKNYYCAYPQLVVSGGASSKIRLQWAEGLFTGGHDWDKANRSEIDGKLFVGVGDSFEPDGGQHRHFETLWWESGRYIEVTISTADQPLTIEKLAIRETHYPYPFEGRFEASDQRLAEVIPLALRTLEMCSHETYMDCPYYEQLMYIGDTRLEVLATYVMTRDDRLPRKALMMFDASILSTGLTQSRYPSRIAQIIPPFSLWFVAMVHDFALWRDDLSFVAERMPGVRAVLDAFIALINRDGLVEAPNGWNYTDWVPAWNGGTPPEGEFGISSIINFQTAMVLRLTAELEDFLGERELAQRNRRNADRIAKAAAAAFWNESRGIFADDLAQKHFSEHAQCMALLGESVPANQRDRVSRGLLEDAGLSRATIYFSYYLFETYRLLGRIDKMLQRMPLWFELKKNGLYTTIEMPEPSRSDCHAWGAHPVFHYFATIAGIRPDGPGFKRIKVQPQLGPLRWARGKMAHPNGEISFDLRAVNGKIEGQVRPPAGTTANWPQSKP